MNSILIKILDVLKKTARTIIFSKRRWRYLLLVVIIVVFAVLKLDLHIGIGRPCLDGDYYFQIARNVAEGNGFSTNLSLYNQGLKSFPHKINQAPVWPLVMGFAGKIFDLEEVALNLPEIFFLINLILLYFLTNRLVRRAGFEDKKSALIFGSSYIDIGHLMVVIFATNRIFFQFTSIPYTEGLAFFFAFLSFIAADMTAETKSFKLAALTGVLATLSFLTRMQMIGVPLALPVCLGVAGFRDRKFFLLAFVAGLASVLAFLPWVAWVASWAEVKSWRDFIGGGSIQETPELRFFSNEIHNVADGSLLAAIKRGLKVAFSPDDKNSYGYSFGWAIVLVPLALGELLTDWSEIKRVFKRITSSNGTVILMMVVAALVMLVPLHTTQRQYFKAWLFGWRHGLPYIFLLTVSICYLLTRRTKLSKALVVGLCAFSIFTGSQNINTILQQKNWHAGLYPVEKQLVNWLDSQNPKPIIITDRSHTLAALSHSYFHWMDCKVDPRHTMALLEKSGADYVLTYRGTERCRFFRGIKDKLKLVKSFKKGWTIKVWALKNHPDK